MGTRLILPTQGPLRKLISSERGLSIIETLIAVALIAIAILGSAAGTSMVIKSNKTNYVMTVAINLAQDKLEELKANPTALASGGPVTDSIDGVTFSRSWTVTNNTPMTGMKKIDVTVTWTNFISQSLTLSSAISG